MEAFQAFDKAGNGFIMADDLRAVLTTLGNDTLTDDEAQTIVDVADKDGDGVLDYDEIVAILREQALKITNAMERYRSSTRD